MFVDPEKLAWMFAASIVCGIVLELFWETLGLFGCAVRYRRGGIIVPGSESTAGLVVIFIKDIIYFTIAGVVMSVLIYWTNDGEPRYLAFAGVIAGYFITHRTLGRLLRRVNEQIVIILFRVISIFLYPLRMLIIFIVRAVRAVQGRLRFYRMVKHTLRRIRALEAVRKQGVPDERCG